MKKSKYMGLEQAERILDYGRVPPSRDRQLQLISIIGYTKIRGVNRLSLASDQQIYRIAQKLFLDAGRVVNHYWKTIEEEENQATFPEKYHAFLCDSFNLPESERENYAISELEEQFMQ